MPPSKNQKTRIQVINECLSKKGTYWTKQKLIDQIAKLDINVADRTIDKDIQDMRFCNQLKHFAPIEFCRQNNGYHYTDPDYSTEKIPLTGNDIKSLELAATTLKQYQYIPIMKEFTTTIDKIIRVVNRAKQSNHESILEFIEFEKTPVASGLEFIDMIIDAIQNRSALNIAYQKFGFETSLNQILHPYFLKEYRNRWYVIGFNELRNDIRTYSLDRIKSLSINAAKHVENTLIDTKEYLGSCVGINLGDKKIETVRLWFSPQEGHYLRAQALHKSQKIIEDCPQKGLILEYQLIINYELTGIILGYGSDVKVLEPKPLADKIVEISQRIIKQYSVTQ